MGDLLLMPGSPTAVPLWRDLVGAQLRQLRVRRGDRLVDVAGRAGVSPQYLSEVERGVKDPSSELLAAIAGALDVDVVQLAQRVLLDLTVGAPAPPAPRRLAATTGPGASPVCLAA